MFNPERDQPLNVFFDLKMGGLEKIYEYPNTPIDFKVHYSLQNMVGLVEFTLFDEAGFEVEPYIWNSRDEKTQTPGGTFKWGYTQPAGIESEENSFFIINYVPRYMNRAFYLTVYGMLTSQSVTTSSNHYSGTIENILKDVAKVHDLELKIDPPFGKEYMLDVGSTDRNTTERREKKHKKRVDESDWGFINRLLYHARDQNGKVGYQAALTDIDGKGTIVITKGKGGSADYEYDVQAEDTVVIDWNPNVQFSAIFDQSDTQFNGYQNATGYPCKMALAHESTKDALESFGQNTYQTTQSVKRGGASEPPDKLHHICPESMPSNVVGGAIRQRLMSSRSPWSGSIPALYSQISRWMGLNTASLQILGDPRIKILSSSGNAVATVDVKFKTPINYFNKDLEFDHYTGGNWQVTDVLHQMTMGEYTTLYGLQRPGHDNPPESGK